MVTQLVPDSKIEGYVTQRVAVGRSGEVVEEVVEVQLEHGC